MTELYAHPEEELPGKEVFEQIPKLPNRRFGFDYGEDKKVVIRWLGIGDWETEVVNEHIEHYFSVFKNHNLHPRSQGFEKKDLPNIWLLDTLWDRHFSPDEFRNIFKKYKQYEASNRKQENTPPETEVIRSEMARVILVRMEQMRLSTHGLAEKSRGLGRQYKLSQRTVSNFINDQDSNPTLTNLIKIAAVLEIELWQLLKPGFADQLKDGTIKEKEAKAALEMQKLKKDMLNLDARMKALTDKVEWEEIFK